MDFICTFILPYTTYFIFGKQYGEAEVSEEITLEPVKEIIEVGTKAVEAEKPTESETKNESKGNAETGAKETEKESVKTTQVATLPKTGEIDYRAVFTPAALTILAGLGLIVNDKKRKVEEE